MSSRNDRLRRRAPHSTSHGRIKVDIEIFNDLPLNLAVSDAEIAALELLLGWDLLSQLLCGGDEPDV